MSDPQDGVEDIVVTGKKIKREPDQLYLLVDGVEYSGWEEVSVSMRADAFPNAFSCTLSAAPKSGAETVAKAGDDCTVLLGDDKVIRGWIDRDVHSGSENSHTIQIMGRGHTQDLVDCSAVWPTALISGDCHSIASQLAQAYTLVVNLLDGADPGPQIPGMAVNYGESSADIIQRCARNAGLLAYEGTDGNLVLATVGTRKAASGVKAGDNVLTWSISHGMDQRYSEIVGTLQALNVLGDVSGSDFFWPAKDPNVRRFRRLNLIADNSVSDDGIQAFTERRAQWEVNRRLGQSISVVVMVDSWRDSSGALWEPNTLVPVELPGLRAPSPMIVTSVEFRRSANSGTTATLVLAPPEALSIEPISLLQANTADLQGPAAP